MQLPEHLQQAIETLADSCNIKSLREGRERVSADYRSGADSHRAFGNRTQLISYLITRFPATFAVCHRVFEEVRSRMPALRVESMLDLGAGPGSATWAGLEVFGDLKDLHLIEREAEAIEMGKKLSGWTQAKWTRGALERETEFPKVDLAVLSYVLGEMKWEEGLAIVERLWKREIPVIVLIEPGTPKGYERIIALRDKGIEWGAQVVAPCPHRLRCPMAGTTDWCHFPARIERTRLHRQLKGGTLGYEDEKFSYVVLTRLSVSPIQGRVVYSPNKGSGHVKLPLCCSDGELRNLVVTRKDKEHYRSARDAEWGSAWL